MSRKSGIFVAVVLFCLVTVLGAYYFGPAIIGLNVVIENGMDSPLNDVELIFHNGVYHLNEIREHRKYVLKLEVPGESDLKLTFKDQSGTRHVADPNIYLEGSSVGTIRFRINTKGAVTCQKATLL